MFFCFTSFKYLIPWFEIGGILEILRQKSYKTSRPSSVNGVQKTHNEWAPNCHDHTESSHRKHLYKQINKSAHNVFNSGTEIFPFSYFAFTSLNWEEW